MLRLTLKNLGARKFRLILTSLSVVIGVAFMAGTFVLTDTMGSVFDDLFADVNRGVDVAVRSREAFDETAGGPGAEAIREPVDASLVDEIEGIDGVADAEGAIGTNGAVVVRLKANGEPGKAVETQGPPQLGVSWGENPKLNQAFNRTAGKPPRAPDQVALDERTAEEAGITAAAVRRCARGGTCDRSRVQMVFNQHPPEIFDVVGIFRFGDSGNPGGATLAAFDTPTAQEVLNRDGTFDTIRVEAEPGVAATVLRDRVRATLRDDGVRGVEVLTGDQLAEADANEIQDALSFFNIFLLIFAVIALFTGAFIIYNTFSILVAQRARELGLLRALGASGRQVNASVALEALLVGVLSSVIGLGLGILVAFGLQAMLTAFGIDLPSGNTVIAMRTIVVSLVVGTIVTLVSAIFPARRAARVAPIAALRDEATTGSSGNRRYVVGAGFAAVGLALITFGLITGGDGFPGGAAGAVGFGAALVFIGVAMLSPLIAVPVARVIGWPQARFRGEPGVLARENALRNPRRTASTAAALMIGLALITVVAIFGASLKKTIDDVLTEDTRAEFLVTTENFSFASPEAAAAIRDALPGSQVTEFRFGQVEILDDTEAVLGTDTNLPATLDVHPRGDAIRRFRDSGGLLVFEDAYDELPARVRKAGEVSVRFSATGRKTVPIAGVFETKDAVGSDYLLSMPIYEENFTDQADAFVAVKIPPGLPLRTAERRIERSLEPFPTVKAESQSEFAQSQAEQLDQILNLMTVLLLLAVLIALAGIINTLALSMLERTREIGLLRAVGMTRKQLKRMVRYEAWIIAVFGAALGLVLGLVFGAALMLALESEGIGFAIPIPNLILYLVLAGLAGLVAGIPPARRAQKLDVLKAVSST